MGRKSKGKKKNEKHQLVYQWHRKGGKEIHFTFNLEHFDGPKQVFRELLEAIFALEVVDIRLHISRC